MAKMNANIFITKDYENEPPSGSKKTNPIQTQSNPVLSAVEWANLETTLRPRNLVLGRLDIMYFDH